MKARSSVFVAVLASALALSFGLLPLTAAAAGTTSSTTTVTDNAAGVVAGGSFTFTATVTGSAGTPSGDVTWAITDPNSSPVICSASTTTLDGSGQATCTINAPISGTYSATVDYLGDATYDTSPGSDPSANVGSANSSTAVSDNAAGVETGGSFTFTATVSGSVGTPTGSVTWAVTAPNANPVSCSSGTTTLNGNGQATCTVQNVITGSYSATLDYLGDSKYGTSSGSDSNATVGSANSTTAVTDNAAGVVTGGGVAFTATVSASAGTPTGNVIWSVTAPNASPVNCSGGNTKSLSGSGQTTCTITNVVAGTYSATAGYQGDLNYRSSSGSDRTATVSQATPSTPTISNLPGGGTFGGGFTAVVSTTGDGTPSVTSNTPAVCSASGLAVAFVGVGTCSLNAQVAAGANYLAASGAAQTLTIGRATPTAPSVTNVPAPANEFFDFTAIVGTTGDGPTRVTSSTSKVCSVSSNGLTVTFVGFGVCTLTPSVSQGTNYFGATGSPVSFPVQEASHGYWLVGSDGGIFSFGTAAFHGSMGGTALQRPVVAITPTSTGNGYWLVASDGGIFSFGDSTYHGSLPGIGLHPAGSGLPHSLNAPIVGMVPTYTGDGYFMVASDGGVFAFGDARFEGSCPGIGGCAGTAVAVMPDHTGNGYWLVTNTGGVYAFGDAGYYGGPSATPVHVVDGVATRDGNGYWLLFANGVVDNFGDADSFGSPTGYVNGFNPATTIFPTVDNQGYWVASARGDVFSYGDSPFLGSMAAAGLNGEIIGAFGF
jgi:hypothetical protein